MSSHIPLPPREVIEAIEWYSHPWPVRAWRTVRRWLARFRHDGRSA